MFLLPLIFSIFTEVAATSGYDFVDPLIGTVNGGHVFPGATLPFGMAKAVADVNGEAQGGFASDGSQITGEPPGNSFGASCPSRGMRGVETA
jgi:putative alpha-1,2-mannosidase